ncbi:hypothetical protein [Halomarina oriensis]|uniref:Uncharacterized protein n=1 Tax=Halomarina oriensis TaxID=671145 RepID=A0A6B0GSZ9_9EURY|nr:hypothetical protein [Halomarina oriensis]MWG34818.1 hypothetical protein [Halomarina oriensis]
MLWKGFELFQKHFGPNRGQQQSNQGPKPGQHVTSGDQKAWREFVEEKRRTATQRSN